MGVLTHSEEARAKIRAARARQTNVRGGGPVPIPAFHRVLARSKRVGECLEWTGAVTPKGYGHIGVGSMRDGTRRVTRTHKVIYEAEHGPVPAGLEIDHLCHNRRCVRIDHLEAVTHRVNLERRITR